MVLGENLDDACGVKRWGVALGVSAHVRQ
jgi:hypothetical protein